MRSGKEERQPTSCPHRVLRCTAPPHPFPVTPRLPFPLLVTALSALLYLPPRLPSLTILHFCSAVPRPGQGLDCLSQRFVLSSPPGSPHGIGQPLHVRVSPRRHLDIGQAWCEQPRHHPTSAVPSTSTATGTSTRTSTRRDGHGPAAESINDRFTNNLTLTHLARSQPFQSNLPTYCRLRPTNSPAAATSPTSLVLVAVDNTQA